MLTGEEEAILNMLADVWNAFSKLTAHHPQGGRDEFHYAIRTAQNVILARPTVRVLREENTNEP